MKNPTRILNSHHFVHHTEPRRLRYYCMCKRCGEDPLAVFVLLEREYVFVEVLLKFLVGKVDVELLVSIHLEILKPENVQNPNKAKGLFPYKRKYRRGLRDCTAFSNYSAGIMDGRLTRLYLHLLLKSTKNMSPYYP